jgi:hypothetical protein
MAHDERIHKEPRQVLTVGQTKREREKPDPVGMPQPTSYEKLPSTLYKVYEHAPQLLGKARSPRER